MMDRLPHAVARYLDFKERRTTLYKSLERACIAGANLDRLGGVAVDDFKHLGLALPLTALYIAAFIGILIGLTALGTASQLDSPYLALTVDPKGKCDEVPQPVSGSFEGSWDGKWQTDPDFDASKSLFIVEFVGSSVSNAEYTSIFKDFATQLAVLGNMAKTRNSAFANLMYASYTLVYSGSNLRFFSSADATQIFFQQLLTATVSSRWGTCDAYKVTGRYISGQYDSAKKAIVAEVPILLNDTYLGNSLNKKLLRNFTESCPQQLKIFNVLDPSVAANKGDAAMRFTFDINTMITVLTTNLGFNSAASLTRLDASIKISENGGKPPIKDYDKLVAYMDPNSFSPDKTPMYCYDKTLLTWLTPAQVAGPDICFLATHDDGQNVVMLYYPVLTQLANDPTQTDKFGNMLMNACQCPYQKKNAYCNYQDDLWGLVFDAGNSTHPGRLQDIALAGQAFLVADPENGDIAFSKYWEKVMGFTANVDYAHTTADLPITADYVSVVDGTPRPGGGAWANGKSYKSMLRDAWDTVCPWGTCSAFVFESYADETTFPYLALNKYHVQLAQFSGETFVDPNYTINPTKRHKLQMCTDTLSMSDAMAKLGQKAPITLTQRYFQCRPNLTTAIVNAIGNAAGSAGLAVQIGSVVIGTAVVFFANLWLRCTGRESDMLMKHAVKREVILTYEKLKIDALCEMFKSSVDTLAAVKHALRNQNEHLLEQNALLAARVEALEQIGVKGVADTVGLTFLANGGQRFGSDALHVLNTIEGAVESEIHELETALNLANPAAKENATDAEEQTATEAIQATEEEKEKEQLLKLLRSEDDIEFFQEIMVKKFERIKLLFNMADETQSIENLRARLGLPADSGDDANDEHYGDAADAAAERERERELADQTSRDFDQSIIGQVGFGLSYLNPFSYVSSSGSGSSSSSYNAAVPHPTHSAVELTAAERAEKQLQGLPKVDQRYILDPSQRPHAPMTQTAVPRRGDYRDMSNAAPAVDSGFCMGTNRETANRNSLGAEIDPSHFSSGWESDSDSDSDGDGDGAAGRDWRAKHLP